TVVPAETSITAGAYLRLFGRSTWLVLTGEPGTTKGAPPLLPEEHAARTNVTAKRRGTGRRVIAPAHGRGPPGDRRDARCQPRDGPTFPAPQGSNRRRWRGSSCRDARSGTRRPPTIRPGSRARFGCRPR